MTSTEKEKETEKKTDYRGGFFDEMDWSYLASLLSCMILFALFTLWVKSVDYSHLNKVSLDRLSNRVVKIIMPNKIQKKKPDPSQDPSKTSMPKDKSKKVEAGDVTAAARIERAKKTVAEAMDQAEERITKAKVLTILSGKGPGTAGRPMGKSLKKAGFDDWGDLDSKLAKIEGLTKIEAKQGSFNREGRNPLAGKDKTPGTASITDLVKGFENAKVSVVSKIGSMQVEKPEIMSKTKYTGNRDPNSVAGFINKKQSTIGMLYEEKLKTNPALEGKITVIIIIEENGKISSATISPSETTLRDGDFQAELLRRIKRWVFPPATGGPVEIKSPFIFKPS